MRKGRTGWFVVATLAVMAALAGSLGTAGAGGPSPWTKLDSNVDSTSVAGLDRASDSALHAVWSKPASTNTQNYGHLRLSPNGVPGATTDVFAAAPPSLHPTPKLVRDGSGMRLVFAGLPQNTFLTATAPSSGTPWSAPAALGTWGAAYGSYGLGADTLANGTVTVGGALNSELYWHQGLDDTTGNDQRTIAGASILQSNLAVDEGSDETWMVWYDQGTGQTGVWAARVEPTIGVPVRGPGSSDPLSPNQQLSLVAAEGGGLYTAYCVGYPECTSMSVWEVGTDRTVKIPGSRGATNVAIGPARDGRIWALWRRDGRLYTARSNVGVTKFAPAVDLGAPPDTLSLLGMTIDGVSTRADILVVVQTDTDLTTNLWHIRALPTLSVKASPKRFDGDNETTVTFTVTDAGAPVARAKVRVAGKKCTTDDSGRCTVTIAPREPGKPVATARKRGYAPGITKLTIRP